MTEGAVGGLVARAERALADVGRDPHAALAEADAVVAAIPRPRAPEQVRAVVTAHRAAGLALVGMAEPALAERRMRRAVVVGDRAGDAVAASEARMSLAYALLEVGRTRAALTALRQAETHLSGVAAARLQCITALALQQSGDTAGALRVYAQTLPRLEKASDSLWVARLRNNRSMLLASLGRTAEAIDDLEAVRRHDLDAGRPSDAAESLYNLGYVLGLAGDIPAALRRFDEADEETGGAARAQHHAGRAEVLLRAGLVQDAIEEGEAAVAALAGRGWNTLEAEARMILAQALLLRADRASSDAAELAREAARLLGRDARPEWTALADYVEAVVALRSGWEPALEGAVVHAADRLGSQHQTVRSAELRVLAARVAQEAGEDLAAARLLEPVAAGRSAHTADMYPLQMSARALLAHNGGKYAAARRYLRDSWDAVDLRRAALGSTELRANWSVHAGHLVTLGMDWAADRRAAGELLEWSERGRQARLRFAPVRPPDDAPIAEALARARWAAALEDQAVAEGRAAGAEAEARRRAERRVIELTRHSRGEGHGLAPSTTRELSDACAGAAFAHLSVVRDRLLCVVVDDRGASLLDLGAWSELGRAVDRISFLSTRLLTGFGGSANRWEEDLHQALAVVDRAVALPLLDAIDGRALAVCPPARLRRLPWGLLPSLNGRPLDVALSATSWVNAARVAPGLTSRITAIAGPGLPAAAAEARHVAAEYPRARALVGHEARADRLIEAARSSDLVHVAAHAVQRRDNPLLSALLLFDGPVTGYDLEATAPQPGCWVLSACRTGSDDTVGADESIGIASILTGAGSRTVLAPLFAVPDDTSLDVMASLHRAMAAGASPAHALASTQQRWSQSESIRHRLTAGAFVSLGRDHGSQGSIPTTNAGS